MDDDIAALIAEAEERDYNAADEEEAAIAAISTLNTVRNALETALARVGRCNSVVLHVSSMRLQRKHGGRPLAAPSFLYGVAHAFGALYHSSQASTAAAPFCADNLRQDTSQPRSTHDALTDGTHGLSASNAAQLRSLQSVAGTDARRVASLFQRDGSNALAAVDVSDGLDEAAASRQTAYRLQQIRTPSAAFDSMEVFDGSMAAMAPPEVTTKYLFDRPPIGFVTGEPYLVVDSQEVILPNGDMRYIAIYDTDVRADDDMGMDGPAAAAAKPALLTQPIASLMDRVRHQMAEAQAERLAASRAAAQRLLAALDAEDAGIAPPAEPIPPSPRAHSALWVDKYAPRAFADLLSSEQINRNVLRWIKLWDRRVPLGRAQPSAPTASSFFVKKEARGGAAAARGQRPAGNAGRFAPVPAPIADDAGMDERSRILASFGRGWRPDAKVLLLCGAPGMGKTTLAHIAAKHAGYRPVEINASDDRSGKTIRERISTAQSMRSVFGDCKPPLIILDEIDGMDGTGSEGGVAELCAMIRATPSLLPALAAASGGGDAAPRRRGDDGENDDDDDDALGAGGESTAAPSAASRGGRSGGSKPRKKARVQFDTAPEPSDAAAADGDAPSSRAAGGSGVQPLTRPLLCICNDQYAPCLRELRPLVQVVEFGSTPQDRLVARLKAICRAEGLSVTQEALQTLAALTDNDIRSCLNTLQFVKYQADSSVKLRAPGAAPGLEDGLDAIRVTSQTILRASVGVKDQTKALHDVWSAVFRKPDTRMRSTVANAAVGISVTAEDIRTAHVRAAMGDAGRDTRRGSSAAAVAAAVRAAHFNDLMAQLSAYTSEPRLLLAGLHENMLQARVNDPTLLHTWSSNHWLSYGDVLQSRSATGGTHALIKYLPAAALAVHVHLASDLAVKVLWPRADGAVRSASEARSNIVQTFLHGWSAASGTSYAASTALDAHTVVLDILSPLVTIISPPLRPVNFGLMNSREKKEAQELVDVMASVGLTYAAKLSLTGADAEEQYDVSPAIVDLLRYEGHDVFAEDLRTRLPDVVKPLIAHEVRLARIRSMHRREKGGDMPGIAAKPATAALPAHIAAQIAMHSGAPKELSAKVSEAVPALAEPPPSGGIAFLAAAAQRSRAAQLVRKRTAIAAAEPIKPEQSAPAPQGGRVVLVAYRYQEGYSNAVRRPMRLADFL